MIWRSIPRTDWIISLLLIVIIVGSADLIARTAPTELPYTARHVVECSNGSES